MSKIIVPLLGQSNDVLGGVLLGALDGDDSDCFSVGKTRILEAVLVNQVVWFRGELNTVSLDEETVVVAKEHPL
jgi:hypothetical protein